MLFLLVFVRRWPYLLVLLGAASYLASLSWHYQQYQAAQQAILTSAGKPVRVMIDTTPTSYPDYTKLSATILSGPARGFRLSLRWQQPPRLAAGQHWLLRLQPKPLHGLANPGGINREASGYINSLIASAQVAPGPHILFKQTTSWRQRAVSRVEQAISPYRTAPLLKALAVGEREFSDTLWQGAQHAGLGHLLAISGLHIGLVFGWVLWLGNWTKGLLPIRRQQLLVLFCGLVFALVYAWLANFAIPTLRASIALLILVICRSQLTQIPLSRFWLLLVALLLLVQPFWVLSASFWLSVLAVATIFVVLWRYPLNAYHWRAKLRWLLLFHLLMSLIMTLLGIILFGGLSPLMLFSNLIFVPWCSLIAIPLLLLSLLFTVSGLDVSWLWQVTDLALTPLLWWLEYSASLAVWWSVADISVMSVALMVMLLLAALIYMRKAVWLMLPLGLLLLSGSAMQPRNWQLQLLDSGQRQQLVVHRGQHGLLYDLAPALATQDIAEYPLNATLRRLAIRQLDYVMYRQQLSEHSRQWTVLSQARPGWQSLRLSGQQHLTGGCLQLPALYHNVRIEVVKPDRSDTCIVRLSIGDWRVLVPGKISPATEQALIASEQDLTADVLILANNGSATVNSLGLLQRVKPVLALNAAAFMNGYQQPAEAVRHRLALLQIPLLNTADYGAISVEFDEQQIRISNWRHQRLPFWLEKPPAVAETLATTR